MRKIKDILRLRHEAKLSYRDIAQALDIGYGTVVDYLKRADQAQLQWPLPTSMNERDLGRLLFPTQARTGQRRFVEPDFPDTHVQLKQKEVTKQLLWQEYRQQYRMTVIAMPSSVTAISSGWAARNAACARSIWPARNCLSITVAPPWR